MDGRTGVHDRKTVAWPTRSQWDGQEWAGSRQALQGLQCEGFNLESMKAWFRAFMNVIQTGYHRQRFKFWSHLTYKGNLHEAEGII